MKPIGVIGGTRFDEFTKSARERAASRETDYGRPSSPVYSISIGGRDVKFIYRHGPPGASRFPPQFVNYAANMKALKDEGCENVIVTTAVGDLLSPVSGRIAVPSQIINYTEGRVRTIYPNRIVHVEFANPYCNRLRRLIIKKGLEMGLDLVQDGVVGVVSGSHFSTKAEHSRLKKDGCTLVGMTQYPESVFARELEMCYAALAIPTDYAVNLDDPPEIAETTHEEVGKNFITVIGNVTRLLEELIPQIPDTRECPCPTTLNRAVF